MLVKIGRVMLSSTPLDHHHPPRVNAPQSSRGRDTALQRLYMALAAIQLGWYLLYTHPAFGAGGGTAAAWRVFSFSPTPTVSAAAAAAVGAGAQVADSQLPSAATAAGEVVDQAQQSDALITPRRSDYSEEEIGATRHLMQAAATDGGSSSGGAGGGPAGQQKAAHKQQYADLSNRSMLGQAGTTSHRLSNTSAAAGSTADSSSSSSSSEGRTEAAGKSLAQPPGPHLTTAQFVLRAVFYVWVSTLNLTSASTLWARCADAFSADASAGSRLFGFISAGATLGQLGGSITALALSSHTKRAAELAAAAGKAPPPGASNAVLILFSAALLFGASQLAPRVKFVDAAAAGGAGGAAGRGGTLSSPRGGSRVMQLRRRLSTGSGSSGGADDDGGKAGPGVAGRHGGPGSGGGSDDDAAPATGKSQRSQLSAGFKLVMASDYLLLVCLYLLVTYVVGSLMYFERALVVSKALTRTGERTTFFAMLNSW